MSEQQLSSRLDKLESALFGGPKDSSQFRQRKAEEAAELKAAQDYQNSPAGRDFANLNQRILKLEQYVYQQLRGEEGISNEGPIFRLDRRPTSSIGTNLDGYEEVEITFCDGDDIEHTGIVLMKNITPPL